MMALPDMPDQGLGLSGRVWLAIVASVGLVAGAGAWGYLGASAAHPSATATAPDGGTTAMPRAAPRPPAKPSPEAAFDRTGSRATEAPGASTDELPWPLWEHALKQAPPPRATPLTAPNWRLLGAAQDNGQWRIIVVRQGKAEPEYFKVGQALPGNYRIVSITEEDVTLAQGSRRITLSYIVSP